MSARISTLTRCQLKRTWRNSSPTENEEENDDQTRSMDSYEIQCEKEYLSDLRADNWITLFLPDKIADGTAQFGTFSESTLGARRQRAPDSKGQLAS